MALNVLSPGEVLFPTNFQEQLKVKFGINPSDVRDTVTLPDHQEYREIDTELALYFFKKLIPQVPEPFYLLVYGEKRGENFEIRMAWKILPQVMPEAISLSPINLLRKFAERYGLEITLSNQTERLFFDTRIEVTDTNDFGISNPERHEYVQQIFTKSTGENDTFHVHCALVMCIDIDQYRIQMLNG